MRISSFTSDACLYFFFLISHQCAFAQVRSDEPRPFSLGMNANYGFVLQHKKALGPLIHGHSFGAEIYCEQIKNGRYYWERAYRYPHVGFALGYYELGNAALGKAIYLIYYLEKPLLKGKRGELDMKIGLGAVYSTHPFNLENNYKNIALSSRFSYAARVALSYAYTVTDNLTLKSGLTLTHFSNGAFKTPNSGINLPMLHLGVCYTPGTKEIIYHAGAPVPPWSKKWSVNLSGAFTIKEFGLPGGRKYPGLVLMAHLSRRLNYKSALNIGFDGIYNTALKEEIRRDASMNQTHRPDFKRAGLAFGHELYISQRLSLLTQLGIYVYKHYSSQVDAPVYQRYGLRYNLNGHLFGGMYLKSHYGTADFVEWAIGVSI